MTASAVAIDPVVLDVLADSDVVEAVSRIVGWEREIRRQYASLASESEFTSQTDVNEARTRARSNIAQAKHEQANARERLGSLVSRLVEDLVRDREAS